MREDLPSGLVSFLLTDIDGSTRLLNQLGEDAYGRALTTHRDLLRDAFTTHAGVEVDNQGDAFFFAFSSQQDAINGAAAAQRALASYPWPFDGSVKVRMGIHTGTAERTEEGYVGMAVHTAARIASAGHGGQILISSECAQGSDGALEQAGLTLRDLGEHRLKDVHGLQTLFQVVIPELAADFSAPRSVETRPNNLPTPATPFIGRARLVADVRDLVMRDDVRLLTLVGPGGTGKSRVGLRVTSELLHHFDDGAFFIPLASLNDPDLVPATIAATLDIREASDKPITECIADALRDKRMLLLIDNSEQVQAAATHIGAILNACPHLKAIVTSREALRLNGARTIRVPPFELPDSNHLPPLAELQNVESIRLFVDRAKAVRQDFELDAGNARDVVDICRRVDALPLAIELAASRIRSMNPDRLLKALQRRFKVLTGGAEDLLDHQKSLRELIAWSYDLLTADEQRLWRKLAVFVGGCSMEAAQTVCDPDDEFMVELDVESLIDKSLVNLGMEPTSSSASKMLIADEREPRISMLDTLREYALEQLVANGESVELHARYSQWCTALAEQAEPEFRGPNLENWLTRLDLEQNNFRGALEHCLESGSELAPTALRLSAALWFFWYERGYLSEARNWLQQALDADTTGDSDARGSALVGASVIARQQKQLDEARRCADEARSLYASRSDQDGVAAALNELGAIAVGAGQNVEAAGYLDEALDILRETQAHKDRLSFALVARGVIDHLNGDLDEAKSKYLEALQVGSDLGDQNSIATALVNLGEIEEAEEHFDQAYTHYRDSLRIYGELGLQLAIAYCMEVLAGFDIRHMDRPEQAALLFGAADALREQIDAPIEEYNAGRLAADLQATRDALGDDEFAAGFQAGRQFSVAAVLEDVLDPN